MIVIGLTGGIACGKSTVSRRLQEYHKIPIIDADKIAREVVEPGEDAYNKIVAHFQPKIPDLLLEDGHLNRPALGRFVFENAEDLKMLNGITHPAVRYTIFRRILWYYALGYGMCVLDVPLLFEANLDTFCGLAVSVVCKSELQLERLLVRNPTMSKEEAQNRIDSQIPMNERIERSDYVIENNKDLKELYAQVDTIVVRTKPTLTKIMLEYFPPFGLVSAASVILSKMLLSRWRSHRKSC